MTAEMINYNNSSSLCTFERERRIWSHLSWVRSSSLLCTFYCIHWPTKTTAFKRKYSEIYVWEERERDITSLIPTSLFLSRFFFFFFVCTQQNENHIPTMPDIWLAFFFFFYLRQFLSNAVIKKCNKTKKSGVEKIKCRSGICRIKSRERFIT